jgi:hypothetical protein
MRSDATPSHVVVMSLPRFGGAFSCGRPPSQGWRTFLRNHAPGIAAMDLFVAPTIGLLREGR